MISINFIVNLKLSLTSLMLFSLYSDFCCSFKNKLKKAKYIIVIHIILIIILKTAPAFIFLNVFNTPENKFAKIISADDNKINTIPTTTNIIINDTTAFFMLYLFIFSFFITFSFILFLLNFIPSL